MKNNKLEKVVVIVGPTASGKSKLALILANEFKGEIVSADSMQIYKGLDIGTAKPTRQERRVAKHYLIDIKKPGENYSVGQFKIDAVEAIHKILKKRKRPIMVGGTGLYVSSVVNNLDFPKVKENKTLRRQLEKEIEENGLKPVFDRLVELDPEAAYIVNPDNPRRVIRALEVALTTGRPFTEQRKRGKPLFDFLQIGLAMAPEILKMRIEKRIRKMFYNGLVEEVKELVEKYGEKQKAFEAFGYREIIQYLKGEITLEQSKELMIKNTWHYAKRQLTWFNKDKAIKWIDDPREAEALVLDFFK